MSTPKHLMLASLLLAGVVAPGVAVAQTEPAPMSQPAPSSQAAPASQGAGTTEKEKCQEAQAPANNSPFKYGTVQDPGNPAFKYGTVNNPCTPSFAYGSGNPAFPFANGTVNPSGNNTNNNQLPGLNNVSDTKKDDEGKPSMVGPYVLYGSAGLFGAAGIATGILAFSLKGRAQQAAIVGSAEVPDSAQAGQVRELLDSTKQMALISDISFGVSVTSAITGVLLAKRAKARAERAAAASK